jgi:hypothetical protein
MAFTPVATTDTLETFRTRYNATPLTIVDDSSTSVDITLATDSLKLSGGTGIASAISGDTVTFNLSNTGVSAATYGSSTAIPVLAVNAQGQITSASTASISTDLTLVDDASTSATISLATDTLKISGGTGTTSSISGDTVTINLDNTAVSAGSVGSSSAIPVLTIDAQGRITAASTASVSSDLTIVDDSSTSETITLGSETLKFAGGTGITTAITSGTVTISKSGSSAHRTLFKYTATSGQTTFSGSDANGNTLAYSTGNFDVFLNGVLLDATDFTASNGTSVVLASAAAADDILSVLAYQTDSLIQNDMNGSELILDVDGDTSLTADTDDQIDVKIAGADDFQFTANDFTALSGSVISTDTINETTSASGVTIDSVLLKDGAVDVNGTSDGIILDADADTTISADTDDQIDIKIGNADEYQLTATTLDAKGNDIYSLQGKIGSDAGDYIVYTTDSQLDVYVNGNNEFRFEADGDFHADGDVIGFSTTVSDVALKSDIEVIPNALDKLDKIKGYTFTRHNGTTSAGIIAQELEKVLPEAVKEKKLSLVDGGTYKTVQYDAIHGLLIQAIKELKNEIRELKS